MCTAELGDVGEKKKTTTTRICLLFEYRRINRDRDGELTREAGRKIGDR